MAAQDVKVLTDRNFQTDILDAATPALVDFSTVQCGPCRAILPAVEALATDYRGRCTIGKLDIDDNPSIAQKYGIRSVPTLLLFKSGQVVAQIVGAVPRGRIEAAILAALSSTCQSRR